MTAACERCPKKKEPGDTRIKLEVEGALKLKQSYFLEESKGLI
jgi:hypothetical protein